jgi:splicing factor U2AF subunit
LGFKAASAETPFYGVPEQAKPLLQTATRILELRNLVTEEEILAMTEEDVKELMEDVRLECLRLAATLGFFFLSTGGT